VGGEHYCEKHAREQTAKEKKKEKKGKKGEKVEKEKKVVKAKPNKCAKCKKKVRCELITLNVVGWGEGCLSLCSTTTCTHHMPITCAG